MIRDHKWHLFLQNIFLYPHSRRRNLYQFHSYLQPTRLLILHCSWFQCVMQWRTQKKISRGRSLLLPKISGDAAARFFQNVPKAPKMVIKSTFSRSQRPTNVYLICLPCEAGEKLALFNENFFISSKARNLVPKKISPPPQPPCLHTPLGFCDLARIWK